MISTSRYSTFAVGAMLFLCFAGTSARGQETGDTSRERALATARAESDVKSGSATTGSAQNDRSSKVTEVILGEGGARNTAPVSYLLPNLTTPESRPAPESLAGETPAANAPQGSSDKWGFMVAPYLWLAGIKGTVGVGDLTTDIDPSVSDILNSLNFGFMGIFEARKNRFGVATDLMYLSIE